MAGKLFKNVKRFMRDEKAQYPDALADEVAEVLNDAQYVALRDEVYMYVIKQLTANPNPESVRYGWDLMGRLLPKVCPSDDFSNYLEVYLRNASRRELISALHHSLFRERPPTVSSNKTTKADPRDLFAKHSNTVTAAKMKGKLKPGTVEVDVDKVRRQFDSHAINAEENSYQPPPPKKHEPPPPPPKAPPKREKRLKMLYDYETEDPNQLAFKAGDLLDIKPPFDTAGDWTLAHDPRSGKEGYVPRTYAEVVDA
jgi:hypothetical protein